MASVQRAESALLKIIQHFKNRQTVKLTVVTEKGELKVVLEENYNLNN
jgi:hypothetical protein